MDLDALRYMGTVTSPFHGNVQFDRHPTEGGSGFSALREYRNPSPRGQSRTREAQPPQSGGLFGIDVTGGLFGMQAGSYGGGGLLCLNHQDSREGRRCKRMR